MIPSKIPATLSRYETKLLFSHIDPNFKSAALLLYGSEIRRSQCLRLRVNDVDLSQLQIRVWCNVELKHKFMAISPALLPCLKRQIDRVKSYLLEDLSMQQSPHYFLTSRLEKKYKKANLELGWHYLFPSNLNVIEPSLDDEVKRHHIGERPFNLAIANAVRKAGISKQISSQTLRHSFSALLQNSADVQYINAHLAPSGVA